MTLYDVIGAIEAAAARQPSVNMIVRQDIYRLNDIADARYGVFGWLQGQHRGATQRSTRTYGFTLFYVDRLIEGEPLDDTAAAGMEAVQSVAVETLDNIVKALAAAGIMAEPYTFRTFNQRFADQCAGAYVEVELTAELSVICEHEYIEKQIIMR